MLHLQERRFPLARQIGQLLLEHRDGLVLDSSAVLARRDRRDHRRPAKRARKWQAR
ncbi:hypothetical protein [Streptomyces purpurascens]